MDEAHAADPVLRNAVKLVVWDLDDTFWKGVLSEEAVTPVTENIDLVKRLAARGIISSICSKNDRDPVINELQKLGVWDYFVLPSISFQPKGSSIAGAHRKRCSCGRRTLSLSMTTHRCWRRPPSTAPGWSVWRVLPSSLPSGSVNICGVPRTRTDEAGDLNSSPIAMISCNRPG